jgi:hypothetical protein
LIASLAVAAAAAAMLGTTPAAATSSAAGVPVRQLVTWTGPAGGDLGALTAVVEASGARVVRSLKLASALVVDAPQGWSGPAGTTTVPDRAMKLAEADYAGTQAAPPLRATLGLAGGTRAPV